MQSVSSDYFDYYFGWENSRYRQPRRLRACAQVDGQVRRPDLRGHRKHPRPPVAAGTGHVRPTGQRAPPPIQGTPSVRSEPAAADATRSGASRGRARGRRLSARTLGRLRLLAQGPHHGVLPARCPGEQTRPGCPRRVARASVDAPAHRPDRRITLPLGRADYTLYSLRLYAY